MADAHAQKRVEEAEYHELRMLNMVDLGSGHVTEVFEEKHPRSPVDDLLDSLEDPDLWHHPSIEGLAKILQYRPEGDEFYTPEPHETRTENMNDAYHEGYVGLAVQFASTVRNYSRPDAYQWSWGYMRSVWIYADTYEQAWDLAVTWAEEQHLKDLKKWEVENVRSPA